MIHIRLSLVSISKNLVIFAEISESPKPHYLCIDDLCTVNEPLTCGLLFRRNEQGPLLKHLPLYCFSKNSRSFAFGPTFFALFKQVTDFETNIYSYCEQM